MIFPRRHRRREPGSGQGRLEGERLRLLEVRRGVRTVEEAGFRTAEDSESVGIIRETGWERIVI